MGITESLLEARFLVNNAKSHNHYIRTHQKAKARTKLSFPKTRQEIGAVFTRRINNIN